MCEILRNASMNRRMNTNGVTARHKGLVEKMTRNTSVRIHCRAKQRAE